MNISDIWTHMDISDLLDSLKMYVEYMPQLESPMDAAKFPTPTLLRYHFERREWIMLVRLCSFLLSSCVSFP